MTQHSLFWDGSVLGDCGPYTSYHVQDLFWRSVLDADGDYGVVRGWRDELLVQGTGSPISILAGGAVVYGMFYESDTPATLTVSSPSTGLSRYDYIVLRRDWSTRTVRLAKVTGTAAASPTLPTLTQSAGAVWEIPLAMALVTDGGNITITDARLFLPFPTVYAGNIVTAGMIAQGAVTADKRPDRTRWILHGSGQLRPDSAVGATRTAGASYDYWSYPDAASRCLWTHFLGTPDIVGSVVDLYVWSVPDVNGLGAGVENCQWDYYLYTCIGDGLPTTITGTTNVDQQLRVNTTVYADLLVSGIPLGDGQLLAVDLCRDGAADSYNNAMRVLGIEMRWTSEA